MANFINNGRLLNLMVTMSQKEKNKFRGTNLATRPEYIQRFVLGYEITADLSYLREAFDRKEKVGEADYIKMGAFEAATQTIQAKTGSKGDEYRLRIQLVNGADLTFHLTPGLQKPAGTNLVQLTLFRFADGLKLTDKSGGKIEMPFKKSLEVRVNAAALPSSQYTVTLYKQ